MAQSIRALKPARPSLSRLFEEEELLGISVDEDHRGDCRRGEAHLLLHCARGK